MSILHSPISLPGRIFRRSKSLVRWLANRTTETKRRRKGWMALGEKWGITDFNIRGHDVTVTGWAIAPPRMRSQIAFTCNGQLVDELQYPGDRSDVAEAFPFVPDARRSGMICRHRLPKALQPGEAIEIQCVNKKTGQPFAPDYYPAFLRQPREDDPPIPETARRFRVISQTKERYFQLSGYTQYRLLEWAMRRATGKSFADCQHIFDWGCGCGRVSRYFRDRPAGSFTGGDVDAENVAWCKSNLGFGSYETLPLHPPTGFASGMFDLIFGISVFTHLREPVQNAWLDELHRLTRPGATLLLTFHGDTTMYRHSTNFTDEQKLVRKRDGILDLANLTYDAALAEKNYYRETYHTEAYIREQWGRRFKILDIVPGLIIPQDLVVAQRTGA